MGGHWGGDVAPWEARGEQGCTQVQGGLEAAAEHRDKIKILEGGKW